MEYQRGWRLETCHPAFLSARLDESKPLIVSLFWNSCTSISGGCIHPAIVSTAVGSTSDPEMGKHVLDSNLRTKWIAFGEGQSLWLELAAPTVVDSIAIAFRKARVIRQVRSIHQSCETWFCFQRKFSRCAGSGQPVAVTSSMWCACGLRGSHRCMTGLYEAAFSTAISFAEL